MTTRRAAIVTGAAAGIGAGIADSLLASGLHVVVTDVDPGGLERFVAERADVADRIETVRADVASAADWESVVAAAHRRFGRVDVLVNNAAISPKHDGRKLPTGRIELSEWQRVIDVNLTGAFLGTRAVIDEMSDRGWGRVVMISSQAGHTGARVAGAHYGATKAALLGLARTIAHEYGRQGITSNAITPGRIATPMAAGVADEVNEAMLATIPVGRLGEPRDIGAMVAFLASDAAAFVNGATIDVNGGSRMG